MERKPSFLRAQEFLATRASLGPIMKRVGVVLHANIDAVADAGKRLDDLVQSAFDRMEEALERRFADFSDANQQRVIQFFYAESRGVPAKEQVEMLIAGKDSSAVATAAAQQRHIPEAVQFALVEHCSQHAYAMRALAANMGTRPAVLAPLVEHPDSDVRLAVAAHIGNRMKIEEIALNSEKQNVFDAIVECYEGRFAPFLVPVCRDADKIQQMFDHTTMTPGNARLFIDNPYSPNGVLLDIASSVTTRLMPGGAEALEDVKTLLETRLSRAEDNSAPEM